MSLRCFSNEEVFKELLAPAIEPCIGLQVWALEPVIIRKQWQLSLAASSSSSNLFEILIETASSDLYNSSTDAHRKSMCLISSAPTGYCGTSQGNRSSQRHRGSPSSELL